MAPLDRHELAERYALILRHYMGNLEETDLQQAYEIGREAIGSGLGLLEMTEMHVQAVQEIFRGHPLLIQRADVVERAQAVLMECLAPFEVAFRGFREANNSLRQVVHELKKSNAELRCANRQQRFLANATSQLSQSLDRDETIERIARLSLEELAIGCVVETDAPQSTKHRTLIAHGGTIWLSEHGADSPFCLRNEHPDFSTWAVEHFRDPPSGPCGWTVREMASKVWLGSIALMHDGALDPMLLEQFVLRACSALDNARLYHEAKAAIRAREDMLSIVSHDLRNPLHAIALNAEIIARLLKREIDITRLQNHVEKISSTVKRMGIMVEDILDLARYQVGKFPVSPAEQTVSNVVTDAISMMQILAEQKKIRLSAELECADQVIRCDGNRILQVFSNLVGNAIKFTPEGGQVKVRARLWKPYVLFSVVDTGKGMTADQLPRVFDRLWKAEPTSEAGIGFGLFIARIIIEAHGGAICPDSQPGVGSTFYFTLPIEGPAVKAA